MPHFYRNLLYSTCDQLIARGVISTNTVLVTGPTNVRFEVRIGCKCFFLSFFLSLRVLTQQNRERNKAFARGLDGDLNADLNADLDTKRV